MIEIQTYNKLLKSERNRRWRMSHPERSSANLKRWNCRHPDAQKGYHLKKTYGITLEQYRGMLAAQGGVCAICKQPETVKHQSGKVYDLAVDHDETTKRIRKLLCTSCNNGIGRFKHNAVLLEAAIVYLKEHQ